MAVVATKSNFYTKGASGIAPNARAGHVHSVSFQVACAASDSSGSTYKLCSIPADALLGKESEIRTDLWGFAVVNVGTIGFLTTLANAVARGAGATFLALVSSTQDAAQLPAWQALGLAAAPLNGLVDIYASASAAATGAGTINGKITYRDHT